MEVTIRLPEKVFANVESIANKTHRRIDEVIAEKIEREFSFDIEQLEKQIAVCSDKEILELSNVQMPEKQDKRLSYLLQMQNSKELTKLQQKEVCELMDLNRLTTLKKALAIREISRRKLIVS